MAKKMMTAEEKAKAMVDQDFQEDPNAPYQQDQEVVDAENAALHSAGNLQRQTYKQAGDKSQAEQTAKEEEMYKAAKAKALAAKRK